MGWSGSAVVLSICRVPDRQGAFASLCFGTELLIFQVFSGIAWVGSELDFLDAFVSTSRKLTSTCFGCSVG